MTSEEVSKFLEKYRQGEFCGYFFGTPIASMSRDDLLGLVGWMAQDTQSRLESRDKSVEFLRRVAFR